MIGRFSASILIAIAILTTGCVSNAPLEGQDLLVIVPGCAGDGFWYDALRDSVSENQPGRIVRTFKWGLPLPLYMMNLQDAGVHSAAEKSFARALEKWRERYPSGQLTLVGHSAGCGVILQSLRQMEKPIEVESVILLAPSLSPDYNLSPSLAHVKNCLHVFHSDRDTLWLGWRTSTFGTYDSIKTPAAGKVGFNLTSLDPALHSKVIQHPYEDQWNDLGNDGGHFGLLARQFTLEKIEPLLQR